MGFIVGHMLLVFCIAGFIVPRWLDVFIIPQRRDDWKQPTAPCVLRDTAEGNVADGMESASSPAESVDESKKISDHNDPRDHDDLSHALFQSNNGPQSSNIPKQP